MIWIFHSMRMYVDWFLGLHSDLKFNQFCCHSIPQEILYLVSLSLFTYSIPQEILYLVSLFTFTANPGNVHLNIFYEHGLVSSWNSVKTDVVCIISHFLTWMNEKSVDKDFYSTSFNICWLLKYSRSIRRKSQNVIPLPLSWLLKYPSISRASQNYWFFSTFSINFLEVFDINKLASLVVWKYVWAHEGNW